MARRITAAQQRGKALYQSRVAKAAPFTNRKFPAYGRATASDKRAARVIVDNIYGSEATRAKADFKPILGQHTSIVHLVKSAAEAKRVRALAAAQAQVAEQAFKIKRDNWKEWAAREKLAGRQVTTAPPLAPTVAHHIRRVKSVEEIRQIKKDIGQETPGSIRAVFIKQEKLPSQDGVFSDGDVVRLHDGKWVTLKGWQVVIFRPIQAAAYARDPETEEARVMAQLRKDFVMVAKHFKKTRDWDFAEANTMFSIQVGRHQYYDALHDEARTHAMLQYWRGKYGFTEATATSSRQHRAPVTEWLTGINLILFLGQAGKKQHRMAWEAQSKQRLKKTRARRRQQGARQVKQARAAQAAAAAKALAKHKRRRR